MVITMSFFFIFLLIFQESSHVVWDKIARVNVVDLRSKI